MSVVEIHAVAKDESVNLVTKITKCTVAIKRRTTGSRTYYAGTVRFTNDVLAGQLSSVLRNGTLWVRWGEQYVRITEIQVGRGPKRSHLLLCDQSWIAKGLASFRVDDRTVISRPPVRVAEPSPPQHVAVWMKDELARAVQEYVPDMAPEHPMWGDPPCTPEEAKEVVKAVRERIEHAKKKEKEAVWELTCKIEDVKAMKK